MYLEMVVRPPEVVLADVQLLQALLVGLVQCGEGLFRHTVCITCTYMLYM